MDEQLQNRVTYMIYCINAFADRYHLTAKQAFAYLMRFKGIALKRNINCRWKMQ